MNLQQGRLDLALPEKAILGGSKIFGGQEYYSASIIISKQLAICLPLRYVPVSF
jgi:hypothetical protein